MLYSTTGLHRPTLMSTDHASPLFDITLLYSGPLDITLLYSGLIADGRVRMTVDVFARPGLGSKDPTSIYKFRLLWRRNAARKPYRPLRLVGRVVPNVAHDVDVIIADDWVVGVKHRRVYQIDVDTGLHGITANEKIELAPQAELVTALDYLSLVS